MNKRAVLFSTIITIVLVYILLTQIELGDIFNVLFSIRAHWIILGFILYILSYFFRALRFQILLNEKISIKDLFSIVCVHNMVNNIIPARMGELSYIYLIKKRGISTGEGIATLMIARIFDVIIISFLFFVSAIAIRQLPAVISNALWIIAGFLVIVTLFLFSLVYKGKNFVDLVERIAERSGLNRFRIISLLLKKANEVAKNLEKIKSRRIVFYSLLISILIWCPLYLMNYILLRAMGLNLSIWLVILGSTFSVMSTLLPVQGLGGFGTHECVWTLAFMTLGLPKEVAIASGFGVHIILILYFLILGCYGFCTLKSKMESSLK